MKVKNPFNTVAWAHIVLLILCSTTARAQGTSGTAESSRYVGACIGHIGEAFDYPEMSKKCTITGQSQTVYYPFGSRYPVVANAYCDQTFWCVVSADFTLLPSGFNQTRIRSRESLVGSSPVVLGR